MGSCDAGFIIEIQGLQDKLVDLFLVFFEIVVGYLDFRKYFRTV